MWGRSLCLAKQVSSVGSGHVLMYLGGLFARKNWKNRYFVLQDTMIKYYKTEIHTGCEEALGSV